METVLDNPEDLSRKYKDCFFRYRDVTWRFDRFMYDIDEDVIFTALGLKGVELTEKYYEVLPLLYLHQPELGYINLLRSAIFIKRVPLAHVNKYQRGLSLEKLAYIDISQREKNMINIPRFRGLTSKSVDQLYTRELPTFEQAMKAIVNNKSLSVAFDKDWALALRGDYTEVLHKDLSVGYLIDGSVALLQGYLPLADSLIELGVNVL
jgi:hypothetical protein